MSMNQIMDIRGTQQLMMTPRLQQSIKLLQLSFVELNAYLQEQVMENPLLELHESACLPKEREPEDQHVFGTVQSGAIYEGFDKTAHMTETVTLKTHVLEQIVHMNLNKIEHKIAEILLDALQPSGYLDLDLEEAARFFKADIGLFESVLEKLQSCEPIGIFARSPGECFKLQFKSMNKLSKILILFLNNLDALPSFGMQKFCKKIGIAPQEGQEILQMIRTLNPKPGLAYGVEPMNVILPDVLVLRQNDQLYVELNDAAIPELIVNSDVYQELKTRCRNKEEINYIKAQYNHANWLKGALMQRCVNTLKIAETIIEEQKDFFFHGITALKPMSLKDIAMKAAVHESTVSRITTSKFMQTPMGLFDFKFFFSSKLSRSQSKGLSFIDHFHEKNRVSARDNTAITISSKSIMEKIKKLVAQEDVEAPLSDEDLSAILQHQGIEVARRTVAKYRSILKIAGSSKRKNAHFF
jgi:RNA polymerase sigma-54 factor